MGQARGRGRQGSRAVTGARRIGNALWGAWFLGASIFAFWAVAGTWQPHSALAEGFLIAFFMLHPPGAFWMAYRVIHYEERLWPLLPMAGLPYSYVWYYFERVRIHRA